MFFKWTGALKTENVTNDLHYYKIATQLKPVVKLLQIQGGYPIRDRGLSENSLVQKDALVKETNVQPWTGTYAYLPPSTSKIELIPEKPKATRTVEHVDNFYEGATWKSAYFHMSYCFSLRTSLALSLVIYLSNVVFKFPVSFKIIDYGPLYYNTTTPRSRSFNDVMMTTIGIIKILESIILCCNSKEFLNWLNNWGQFELDFWHCFQKQHYNFNFDIRRFRKFVFLFHIGFNLWLAFSSGHMYTLMDLRIPIFSICILYLTFYSMWINPVIEDCKVFFILHTTTLATEQIRLAIVKCKMAENLESSDIVNWRNLVQSIRQQTALASSYIKSQQLMFVTETVIVGTLCLAFLLEAAAETGILDRFSFSSLLAITYSCFNYLVRLYLKVLVAENLTAEELKMAAEVLATEAKCMDAPTKTELKFLYYMLTQTCVEFNLGNYYTFNKKLLLQVGMMIVTYLIVVIQFRGINNTTTQCNC